MIRYARIVGTGSALPKKVLTNKELESMTDTTDEWIRTRTGIHERHIVSDGETCLSLSVAAAQQALSAAQVSAEEIDLLILATSSSEMIFPATAVSVQHALGCRKVMSFDLSAACTGFLYALSVANVFIRSGEVKTVLVMGTELVSRVLDWEDRTTCVLFGDGAGAVVLKASDEPGILGARMQADGAYQEVLHASAYIGGQQIHGNPRILMNGQQVFKLAVRCLQNSVKDLITELGIDVSSIDRLVPHQANMRIIEAVAEPFALTSEQVVVTINRHGNTSAASIPLALDYAVRSGQVLPGHRCILTGFGGGLAWGTVILDF